MIKIAVLSDIHGNYIAFQECVDYAISKNIDTFVILGDYVGELPYPQKTMKLIYEMMSKYKCFFIKGNKENYWVNYNNQAEKDWKLGNSTTGSLLYTYKNLTVNDIKFFEKLPFVEEVVLDGYDPIIICHGSPNKVNEKMLLDNDKTNEIIEQCKYKYILCGHTHIQGKIEHNNKTVFNPGSVGVPLHSGGKAQFMILHGDENGWKEEFINLEYDVEKIIHEIYQVGLSEAAPYWSKVTEHLLLTGEISHGSVLAKAMHLCKEDFGECNWPNVPEKYWEKAVSELF